MADTPSRRLGLHAPSGGDPAAVPADVRRLRDQLDDVVLGYDQGVRSSRPTAGVEGRMYYATDEAALYYDFGGGWIPASFQPGDLRLSAAPVDPPLGWLRADGTLVPQATYPALFGALGFFYSGGRDPGGGMFRLPIFDGASLVGTGSGEAYGGSRPGGWPHTPRTLGERWGAGTHTLTEPELPAHTHTLTDPGHAHLNTTGIVPGSNIAGGSGYAEAAEGDSTRAARTGITVQPTGRNQPHNNWPPAAAVHVWIRT